MKYVFLTLQKKNDGLFGQPNLMLMAKELDCVLGREE